jgi:alpha-L-fucosidase
VRRWRILPDRACLNLNIPPDRRGRIHENDLRALRGMRKILDGTFGVDLARGATATASNARGGDRRFAAENVLDGNPATYWSTDDGAPAPELVIDLGKPTTFDAVSLREHLPLGQRVDAFAVDAWKDGGWKEIAAGTSIGNRRLLKVKPVETGKVRLRIVKAPVPPAIAEFSLHREPPPVVQG